MVVTLVNAHGTRVELSDLGATITRFSPAGAPSIVLGPEHGLEGFAAAAAVVGRVANRIAQSRFTLDGVVHRLPANEGRHHLHGGPGGFAHRRWEYDEAASQPEHSACFRLVSADGDQGYPGRLDVSVAYALDESDTLTMVWRSHSDRQTPVNLTNHAYFNLSGHGDVLDHELWIDADRWLPIDHELIPTGEIASVGGTPLDFREPRRIGERIAMLGAPTDGYDHCLVFRAGRDPRVPCIRLRAPNGRTLAITTTEPSVQLYTANRLPEVVCAGAVRFGRRGAVCLETQGFPDAVNHPAFPSLILRPGEERTSTTAWCIREVLAAPAR